MDGDPGPFQVWARDHDLGVGSHDAYLTIGQNLGAPDCPVPVDVPWQRTWPAVHLPAWPVQGEVGSRRYTTVTQWWTDVWLVVGDAKTQLPRLKELGFGDPILLQK